MPKRLHTTELWSRQQSIKSVCRCHKEFLSLMWVILWFRSIQNQPDTFQISSPHSSPTSQTCHKHKCRIDLIYKCNIDLVRLIQVLMSLCFLHMGSMEIEGSMLTSQIWLHGKADGRKERDDAGVHNSEFWVWMWIASSMCYRHSSIAAYCHVSSKNVLTTFK